MQHASFLCAGIMNKDYYWDMQRSMKYTMTRQFLEEMSSQGIVYLRCTSEDVIKTGCVGSTLLLFVVTSNPSDIQRSKARALVKHL